MSDVINDLTGWITNLRWAIEDGNAGRILATVSYEEQLDILERVLEELEAKDAPVDP